MKSIMAIIVVSSLCLIAVSWQTSFAQCATGAANDEVSTAIRSFGTHYVDPMEIDYGESFVIDCDAHLISVEASITLTEVQVDGRTPAVMGDLVVCTVYDSAHTPIMSHQLAIPTEDVNQKLTFDFSPLQFKLAAGQYYFMLSTPEDCWAYITMGSEYADGDATMLWNGIWSSQSGDTMFNIQWDSTSDFVSDEGMSWGAMKALYR